MEVLVANAALVKQEMNKLNILDDNNANNEVVVSKLKEVALVLNDNKNVHVHDDDDDDNNVVLAESETEKVNEKLGENAVPAEHPINKKKYNKKRMYKEACRIQVSNTKKPFFFYLNLAKWQLKKHKYVELSALGMAIPTAILISEILKRNGQAIEKKLMTFLVNSKEEENGHLLQKSKILIALQKTDNLIKTAVAVQASEDIPENDI